MNFSFLNIIAWVERQELPCLFKMYFHFDCPGCGFQRSVIELLKGNILESFVLFPTLLALLVFFICFFINNKFEVMKMSKFLLVGISSTFSLLILSYLYKFI